MLSRRIRHYVDSLTFRIAPEWTIRRAWRHVSVIFTRPERDVARLDVARGPMVPPPGRKRPLVGRFQQSSIRREELEVLFGIMTGLPPASAWSAERLSGKGQLCVFSPLFVNVLAPFSREATAKGKEDPSISQPFVDLAERWLTALASDDQTRIASLDVALITATWEARLAEDRQQDLYAWFGQGLPWTLSDHARSSLIKAAVERTRRSRS
jgi:hypothetical protein